MTKPIGLTDNQLHTIQQAAAPLHPNDRGPYLERVAGMLQGQGELGDGVVSRAAKAAQGEFLRPPPHPHLPSKYSRAR
jgi:hypothetical protein